MDFKELSHASRLAIVGIGSELRGDDALGVLLVRKLSEKFPRKKFQDKILLTEGHAAPENVTGEVSQFKPSHCLFIDAADVGLKPGECRFISKDEISGVSFSTHTLPLKIIADYLEKTCGCEVLVLGVQPKCTDFGIGVTPEIASAIERLALEIATGIEK